MPSLDTLDRRGFGETTRRDLWWAQPAAILLGLTAFIIYTTWAAFQGKNYFYNGGGAHYLSPFYSPLLFGVAGEPFLIGGQPGWWPAWAPFSAAFFILFGPAGFRFTCYYYRGSYYKAFWADPPACSVGEPRKSYWGERKPPLILQNIHRYFLYIAILFVLLLSYDAWCAMWFVNPDGTTHFGIGLGTVILTLNAVFLGAYTFGCHSFRHVIGGFKDRLSGAPVRRNCYNCVSALNRRHALWAWISLVWVMFSDVYVRMCAMGIWSDWRIIG